MIFEDDRTEEQKSSHSCLVTATDRCLSGWGPAKYGTSKCAWACRPEHLDTVLSWVKSRKDMKYVRVAGSDWRSRYAAHIHIYVVDDNHPALTEQQ